MTHTLYLDKAFLTELIALIPAIWSAARQCAHRFSVIRCFIAATVATLYLVAALVLPLGRGITISGAICATPILSLIAFGRLTPRGHVKSSALMLAFALMMGGVFFILSSLIPVRNIGSIPLLILSAAICMGVVGVRYPGKGIRASSKSVKAIITLGEISIPLTVYYDSGNTLTDPATGRHVIVTGEDTLKDIHSLAPMFTLPYVCAAGRFTMKCFYPDRVTLCTPRPTQREDIIIGIAPGIKGVALGGDGVFGITSQ